MVRVGAVRYEGFRHGAIRFIRDCPTSRTQFCEIKYLKMRLNKKSVFAGILTIVILLLIYLGVLGMFLTFIKKIW